MITKTVLISGAGIAGSTLAYCLLQHGFVPTIVERAEAFREGGYIIDFWGIGYDAAEKLRLLTELQAKRYDAKEVRWVNNESKRVGGFDAAIFRDRFNDRFFSIQRGDLAKTIYEKVEGRVETIFGETIESIEEDDWGVKVCFRQRTERRFDLVIGADGLHSRVRKLMTKPDEVELKHLGYYCAAFSAIDYVPRDEGAYVCYCSPGLHLARFAIRDARTLFFIIFVADKALEYNHKDQAALEHILYNRVAGCGWKEEAAILEALRLSPDELYFDSVSQVRMKTWHKGRIALTGDAAYCPSLLAGQGAALAIAGAYVLAGELKNASGDWSIAYPKYEHMLKPLIETKQQAAQRNGSWFAPRTQMGIFFRNLVSQLLAVPCFASQFSGSFADSLELPDY